MNLIVSLCLSALLASTAVAQQKPVLPQPRPVNPGGPNQAPSDAVALFDGKDLSHWRTVDGAPARCTAANREMHCRTGAGDIVSTDTFADAQIHLEFAVPSMPDQKGQLRGNSGIFLHSCYEVQILDSYENPTYADGSLGAVYGFAAPLVNAARKPTEWQSYDIVFRAPHCNASGAVSDPGRITILLNGILVQDHTPVAKAGPGCLLKNICQNGPLRIQDHSGFKNAPDTTLRFRNIWLRNLAR